MEISPIGGPFPALARLTLDSEISPISTGNATTPRRLIIRRPMTPPDRGTLFLIDGSNNFYRCYYAIRGLSNSSGLATNAVYGFIQMLRKLVKDHQPQSLAVAFDISGSTFRHKQFEDYKKDRKPMPDDLAVQIPFIYEVCEGFGIPVLTIEEFEADDLIGSLACKARDMGYEVVIATSDKDFFQMVGDGIRLFHTGREVMYDAEGVKEVFGLAPDQVVDVMAIWGDSIDNIPGVPGIGEKGAKALIAEFGTLDNLYEQVDQVKKTAHREKLKAHREQALMSRDLARIRCDLDVPVDIEALRVGAPDRAKLHDLFSRLEFQSLMQEFLPEPVATAHDYRLISAVEELRSFLEGAREELAIFFETSSDQTDEPSHLSLSRKTGESIVLSLLTIKPEVRDELQRLFASKRRFIAHDVKQQLRFAVAGGFPQFESYADTMIMSYVLNPGAYGHELENLVRERLKRDVMPRKDFLRKSGTMFDTTGVVEYLGEKSDLALQLHQLLAPELKKDEALERIYQTLEVPLVPVLAKMESRGIKIDLELLAAMSKKMGEQLAELETKIYADAGQVFNINSPTQLGTILFEKLQYPVLKKTQKTKSSSTGVEVLKELASYGYSVPKLILEHRELHKLKSTYVDALPQLIRADGRVHTSFNQAVASTGRLSSSDPNLQNIPIRTQQGREIRRAFIAEQGNVLLAADYSQIELRILAHVTGDPDLIEAFHRNVDIHRATAAKIFNVAEPLVNPEQRRASKTINFGVLYGMSAFRLSHELGISTGEAKEFIGSYFARYPRIREYLDKTLEEARSTGRVTTLFGRVRQIPEIHNRSFTVRGNAERMATNAPIQGTAADLLKLAMISLDEKLVAEAPGATMLLTVHDEIIIELPDAHGDEVARLVRTTMEDIYPLAVPLAVETHWGKSWYEAKS